MQKYAQDDVPESLEPWPFDNSASDYKILRGDPRASGRLDHGDNAGPHRLGIWACTEGAFECGPGDSIFTRKGERVIWDIREDVTKVFFTAL
jgi:uncharacterized cupin superfamily protein